MPEINDLNVARLAGRFYLELAEDFTAAQMHAVRRRNALYALAGNDACASHEFCDPNMTMLSAYKYVFEAEPAFLDNPDDDAGQESLRLMGAAWAKARKEALTDPDARKAELGAAYVAAIGYDPFEDDATLSADEVAATLAEYAETGARGGRD